MFGLIGVIGVKAVGGLNTCLNIQLHDTGAVVKAAPVKTSPTYEWQINHPGSRYCESRGCVSKGIDLSLISNSGAAYAKVVCTVWLELESEVLPMMCASPTSHIFADSKSPDSNTLPLLMSLCRICRQPE